MSGPQAENGQSLLIGRTIDHLATPAFVVDLDVVKANCERMLARAQKGGLHLRGQTKTHKTVEGAIYQTGGTRRGLVTSTLVESEMYANAGFDDILYGYPILSTHMQRNLKLAQKLESYHLMVTNKESIQILLANPPPPGKKWSVFMKIDCGNSREGFWWSDQDCIEAALEIRKYPAVMTLQGTYVHCGNTYKSQDSNQVEKTRDETIKMLIGVSKRMSEHGIKFDNIGIGSTPSCSHDSALYAQISEIHPGNYVFYDAQQEKLGSCGMGDVAGKVLTRVIGHSVRRNQLLVDCGFSALTKQGFQELDQSFARVEGHPMLKLCDMTQEIGKVGWDLDDSINFDDFPVGSTLSLIPYHACATAAMYPVYYVHQNQMIKEEWRPCRGW
ncbi:hypothetical protein TCAL_15709 [Tigriopus californicus]|uniref:D-serine dehydratase-like domain-containing protein n=1 Tax=Tigriopus californicus TaxID=6832 RepID=A0A553P8E8_TIGCA|nr:D-serine dehydratase-like [Tigriopus californicus]TRY73948.1 hypothetical protein TCAL_15709 [Tigriopus californicus]